MHSQCLRLLILIASAASCISADTNHLAMAPQPFASFSFTGFVGDRVRANIENWLYPAPAANPGLISMFHVRDRQPTPNLVPWAGEFAGKYLISAIQALRMSSHAGFPQIVNDVVTELIATQAQDGYLGPFREQERIRGHWDLWGHYHCMLGLLMWHERTGDPKALDAVLKAADLVCNTYLDTGKRAIDTGSDEMNLSIIHALGWTYRLSKNERYLRMIREIEKDWERGGDYLRAGLAGTEFFQTPRPRWESLHNIQGLVELYRITGDSKYLRAFEHHWRSIARWDLRNSGGFSSGEQATGNPYAPTAIETCCTIAWMALSVDMLSLTGDSRVADLLELATFNAWAGAQHPSGRWCTYNTPMDGIREASAHSIVFQSRHGTPELNCCSVNGPRGWGMLSEWALMRAPDGYVLNWLAPGSASLMGLKDQVANEIPAPTGISAFSGRYSGSRAIAENKGVLWVTGNYPIDSNVTIRVELQREEEFTLRIRIPEWSRETRVLLNNEPLPAPSPGSYLAIKRKWRSHRNNTDTVSLTFDFAPRAVPGAREAAGKVSVYRGPILLAADQRFNASDEMPVINPAYLQNSTLVPVPSASNYLSRTVKPMVLVTVPTSSGEMLTLCDFASAGASGSRYHSWLRATNSAPFPVVTRVPRDSVILARGNVLFRWTAQRTNVAQHLEISSDPDFARDVVVETPVSGREILLPISSNFKTNQWYYWRIVSSNQFGVTSSSRPAARFQVDDGLPHVSEQLTPPRSLDAYGNIASLTNTVTVSGTNRILFPVGDWPEGDYSVRFRFRLHEFPAKVGQLFSAWNSVMDDPLRLAIENGKLFARVENGNGYSTQGVPIELDRWYQLSATKRGSKLSLHLDGQERASCTLPEYLSTQARDFALGGNPHYSGNEFVQANFSDLSFREE